MKLVIPLHWLYWSIHTKDESKRGTAFAFIFGMNWLWRCGVTASFGVFLHEIKCDRMTSFMEFTICSSCYVLFAFWQLFCLFALHSGICKALWVSRVALWVGPLHCGYCWGIMGWNKRVLFQLRVRNEPWGICQMRAPHLLINNYAWISIIARPNRNTCNVKLLLW